MPFVVFYRESEPDDDFYSAEWDGVPAVGELVDLPHQDYDWPVGPHCPELERYVVTRREWSTYTRHKSASVNIYVVQRLTHGTSNDT